MRHRGLIVAGSFLAMFMAVVVLLQVLPLDLSRWWLAGSFEPGRVAGICGVIMFLVAWAVSVQLRASDRVIRHYQLVMSSFLVAWLLIVLLKRITTNPDIVRICWYLFYPCMVGSALALFGCGMRMGFPGDVGRRKVVMGIAATISCVLVALVLSNDLHHLAFIFDPSSPNWTKDYTYGIAYYLTAGWTAALLLGFLGTLAAGLRRQGRRQLISLLIVFLVGLFYCLAYFLRVPFIFRSNFTVFYCILTVLFVELSLDLKLLPSCTWYGTVFRKVAHDTQILSSRLVCEYASENATDIPGAVTSRISSRSRLGENAFRVETNEDADKVYDIFTVHGGWAVVTEDISEIHHLRSRLRSQTEQLRRSTVLLEQDLEVQRHLYRQQTEKDLLAEVDGSISDAVERIRDILDELPSDGTPEGLRARRRQLMLVKLLVAYCKRKGNLVLIEQEGESVSRERLMLMYDETSADLATVGVTSGALVEIESLSAPTTSLLYDCFYDLILLAFACVDPIIMSYIRRLPDGRIEMNAALHCADEVDLSRDVATATLSDSLERRGASFELEGATGSLTLHIFSGGEADG